MQDELAVNYCQLAVVSTDSPEVTAAFRAGLGATFTFLSDHERRAIRELDIMEQTAPDFEHGLVAVPYTFSLQPDDPPNLQRLVVRRATHARGGPSGSARNHAEVPRGLRVRAAREGLSDE
jgi:peroxiredoxin